jgi:hypothetical protein
MGLGHLKIFSRTTVPILTDMAQIILGGWGFKFVQRNGIAPLEGKIIAKELKYTDFFFQNQQAKISQN